MNAMKEKLEAAGADTIGAQLTTACVEALRQRPESIADAWRDVGVIFGHEFMRGLMKDMSGNQMLAPGQSLAPAPYRPRVIPKERLERRRELQKVVRTLFGYKTSDGTDWAEVGAHELDGMDRDGAMARAIKAKIGVLTNEDRFRTVGDLMTAKQFNDVAEQVKRHPIKEIVK